ncbi:hypothetical protein ACNKHK_22020 [Shigella flexneri]
MPLDKVIGSIKAGVGGTLGSLALIIGFGTMSAECWRTGQRTAHRNHPDC